MTYTMYFTVLLVVICAVTIAKKVDLSFVQLITGSFCLALGLRYAGIFPKDSIAGPVFAIWFIILTAYLVKLVKGIRKEAKGDTQRNKQKE